jgi:hypothetical protein
MEKRTEKQIRPIPLDHLYALATVSVLAKHPEGLSEDRAYELATEWLLGVKQTLDREFVGRDQ